MGQPKREQWDSDKVEESVNGMDPILFDKYKRKVLKRQNRERGAEASEAVESAEATIESETENEYGVEGRFSGDVKFHLRGAAKVALFLTITALTITTVVVAISQVLALVNRFR